MAQWTTASGRLPSIAAPHGRGVREVDLGVGGRHDVGAMALGEHLDDVAPDEARAAGDADAHHTASAGALVDTSATRRPSTHSTG